MGWARKARREAPVVAKLNYTIVFNMPGEVILLLVMSCPLILVKVIIMSISIEFDYILHIEKYLGIPLNDIFNKHTIHIEIDDEWFLQKLIICFEAMKESHNGFNIKTRIMNYCKNFRLIDKIFSISLDNEMANTKAMDFLKEDPSISLLLSGPLSHVRCCTHILNLCIQEGITQLQPLLELVRSVIIWIRVMRTAKRSFKAKCDEYGLRKNVINLDTPARWSSTYKLLHDANRYREVLTDLYNESWSGPYSLSNNEH
ncbi:putative AC9 transposase [Bienertia sinuspersici]